jgi:DNA-directed RNA polymerase specialized sigma subunit
MKTAADYLWSILLVHQRIDSKKENLANLQLLATSTGAIRYDKDRVMTSLPQEAGFENRAIDVTMLEKEIQNDIDELTAMYDKGREIIRSVPNPIDQAILDMMFIDHVPIRTIAVRLNYSESNIYYRKKKVMDRLKTQTL